MKCKYCGKNSRAKNAVFCSKKCDSYYSKELEKKESSRSTLTTINLDQNLSNNLRAIQANLIRNTNENITFTQVINLVLEEGIKVKKIVLKEI